MSSAGSNEPVPRQEGISMVLRHHKDHGTCKSVSTSCGLNFLAQSKSFRLVACVLDDTLLCFFFNFGVGSLIRDPKEECLEMMMVRWKSVLIDGCRRVAVHRHLASQPVLVSVRQKKKLLQSLGHKHRNFC